MRKLSGITALILAGGMGTRLREAVSDRPKVLAPVNGRPFLASLLDRLADAGVRRVVLCTGYLAHQVTEAFKAEFRGMQLLYSREEEPLGTGGALRLALPLLRCDPVLVLNGDSFCDADLGAFLRQHLEAGSPASLVLTRVADVARYGSVETDPAARVLSFSEKGARSGEGTINAGIYLLSRGVLEGIPAGKAVSLEREVFPELIGRGLHAFAGGSRFIDIGVPADYHAAQAYLSDSPCRIAQGEAS